jgi:acyl carrier protein
MLHQVRSVLIEVLGLRDEAIGVGSDTPLLGAVAELDSLAVINVITALEDRFAIHVEDDEVSGDIFATLGTLSAFIQEKTDN